MSMSMSWPFPPELSGPSKSVQKAKLRDFSEARNSLFLLPAWKLTNDPGGFWADGPSLFLQLL